MSDAAAKSGKIQKTENEWRNELTPMQYAVLREKATERPFSGEYEYTHTPGTYVCAGCGQTLFESDAKFESGCGWPSFTQPAVESHIEMQWPSRSRLRRWTGTDRPALLYQFGGAETATEVSRSLDLKNKITTPARTGLVVRALLLRSSESRNGRREIEEPLITLKSRHICRCGRHCIAAHQRGTGAEGRNFGNRSYIEIIRK